MITSWYPLMAVLNTSSPVATGTGAPAASPENTAPSAVTNSAGCLSPLPVRAASAHRCAVASITTGSPRSTVCRTAPANVRPA